MAPSRLVWRFLAVLILTLAGRAPGQTQESVFVPLPPCRVVDSRIGVGGISGPLAPGATNRVRFRDRCGIPGLTNDGGSEVNRTTALALNIIAVAPTGFGHLLAWPANQPAPAASVINYSPGQTIANGVVVPMCDQEASAALVCQSGDISFLAGVSSTHLVVDVSGYYIKPHERGSGRHGAGAGFDSFPCVNNAQLVRFGLSSHMAPRASADLLCPAGTWLCTEGQVDNGAGCDTSRADSTCDFRDCHGNCGDFLADRHQGWLDNFGDASGTGTYWTELGGGFVLAPC